MAVVSEGAGLWLWVAALGFRLLFRGEDAVDDDSLCMSYSCGGADGCGTLEYRSRRNSCTNICRAVGFDGSSCKARCRELQASLLFVPKAMYADAKRTWPLAHRSLIAIH